MLINLTNNAKNGNKKPVHSNAISVIRVCAFIFLVIVFTICVATFSGCKKSNVLTEFIWDQQTGKLDENAEAIYKEQPNAPEDPTRTSTFKSENENIAQQEQEQPTFDEENPNTENEQTEQREHKNTNHEYNATKGNESGNSGKTANIASEIAGNGGGGNDTSQRVATGRGGSVTNWDSTGQSTRLPENVHSVAASGNYAILVEMLCGPGALVGTNNAAKNTVASKQAFASEGFENVPVLWSDDGTPNIAEILTQSPNCILQENSTRTLTAEEQNALTEAGLTCTILQVPEISGASITDAQLLSAVNDVGELLAPGFGNTYAGVNNKSSKDMAAEYVRQHDEAINNVVNANGGYSYKVLEGTSYSYIYQGDKDSGTQTTQLSNNRYTTAFVSAWTNCNVSAISVGSSRSYSGTSLGYLSEQTDILDTSDGIGLSISGQPSGFLLMDYYMQCAGVVDNSFGGVCPAAASASDSRALPTVIRAGGLNDNLVSNQRDTFWLGSSPLWFSESGSWTVDTTLVGMSKFPAVLARDTNIATKMRTSANKQNGFYNVGLTYSIYIMPSGLFGSWADGGLESFLLAPYAYCLFQAGDLSIASTYINNYCSTFYRQGAGAVISDFGSSV